MSAHVSRCPGDWTTPSFITELYGDLETPRFLARRHRASQGPLPSLQQSDRHSRAPLQGGQEAPRRARGREGWQPAESGVPRIREAAPRLRGPAREDRGRGPDEGRIDRPDVLVLLELRPLPRRPPGLGAPDARVLAGRPDHGLREGPRRP